MTFPLRPDFSRPSKRPGRVTEFDRLRRRLRLAVGALSLVTVVGILGFLIISGDEHGIVDAIYMTIITLTTVGFGEIIDMSSNPAGRVFTVVLLLVGMGIAAYTVPMLAAFVIEGQLHNIFARRRMQKTIEGMTHHYIVCGDTAATWYLAQELEHTRRPVVLVAPSDETLAQGLQQLGAVPGISGDPTDDDVLLAAGIERAAGVVFSMQGEKDNVLGVLTARRLAPGARIVAATEQDETEPKLRTAGADAVVSPSRIGGLRMASELIRPKVVSFLDKMLRIKGSSLRVEEVMVPLEADVGDRTIESLRVDESGGVLLAVRPPGAGDFEFKPSLATPLEPGLTLIVMADADGYERLIRRATGAFQAPGTEP